ncbi:MAG: hypothetical protein HYX66_04285 [Ignavibacteria bacterium]|nr:hypothetical protein [Ignavibacteria bacterium]
MSIQPEMLERAQSDASGLFDIVLTFTGDSVPSSLESKLTEILGFTNMYSGRLSGKEVVDLSENPLVGSIQEDTEQFLMDDE